jgi:polyhydroxyalkanoate synthesis regulator phasin
MTNLLEQGFYLGLGVLSVTAGKAEEAVKSAIAKAGLNEEEGKKISEQLIDAGKEARANLKTQIEDILAKGHVVLPCHSTIAKLEKRVADLEAEVEKLKG